MDTTLKEKFIALYGNSAQDIHLYFAPGRVNLIGEHTDYNGGYVFPAALTFGTKMLIRKREDNKLLLASTHFDRQVEVSIDEIRYTEEDDWANYPKGIMLHLQKKGYAFGGYEVLIHGDIPNGSGLSSSASLEVVAGYGFLSMAGHEVDKVELAVTAQESENQFMKVNCGIMDQFAVAMGKKDNAILLMCDTLEYKHVPFESGAYKLVIGNTKKRRGLVDSEYNIRRAQCEQAVQDLQEAFPGLKYLGQLSVQQLNEHIGLIADEVVKKRAKHVVEENARVLESMRVLEEGDLAAFGKLMIGSHDSLRDLYEVTGKELDAMVEAALHVPGVLGSRMTGAGFGGCTVSLVHEDHIEQFISQVGTEYQEATGLKADFYVCDIGDGVSELGGEE